MKSLLLKDILTQKANLAIGGFYSLIFFMGFGLLGDSPDSGFAYAVTGIAVGFMLLVGSFSADKNETPRFLFSMPISRAQGVNEKFLLLALGTLYGTVCGAVFGAVFSLQAIGWSSHAMGGLDILRISAGMLIFTFLIPLYFLFGQKTIRYILIGGMGLLVIGQVAGMLVLFASGSAGGGLVIFDVIFGWFSDGDPLRRNLVFLAAGAGTCVVSYVASRAIFARKGL